MGMNVLYIITSNKKQCYKKVNSIKYRRKRKMGMFIRPYRILQNTNQMLKVSNTQVENVELLIKTITENLIRIHRSSTLTFQKSVWKRAFEESII